MDSRLRGSDKVRGFVKLDKKVYTGVIYLVSHTKQHNEPERRTCNGMTVAQIMERGGTDVSAQYGKRREVCSCGGKELTGSWPADHASGGSPRKESVACANQ